MLAEHINDLLQSCNTTRYDLEESEQKIVHILVALLYAVFEIYYIVQTIKLFREEPEMRRNYPLIYFFFGLHVLLIRTILYFLAGAVFCCDQWVYDLIDEYFYKFKRTALLVITYRFSLMLQSREVRPFNLLSLGKIFIGYELIDTVLYNGFYFYFVHENKLRFVMACYNLSMDCTLMIIFFFGAINLIKRTHSDTKFISQLYPFLAIMASREVLHIYRRIWIVSKSDHHSFKEVNTLEWTAFLVMYYIMTELLPCTVMLMFVAKRVGQPEEESEDDDSSRYLSM